jgi:hypothetical protein
MTPGLLITPPLLFFCTRSRIESLWPQIYADERRKQRTGFVFCFFPAPGSSDAKAVVEHALAKR